MRIAILGTGSAGVMAAAHLSHHFPNFQLFLVFDPSKPPIGVGEGTTPGFRQWLEQIAPDSFADLQRECYATVKLGVQFEGWGAHAGSFVHDFVPRENVGLHISAERLSTFLAQFHHAEPVKGRVDAIARAPNEVILRMDGGQNLAVDLVIDARGFPKTLGPEHQRLSFIPTDAAIITRGPPVLGLERTRAVARAHGWIFVIPLSEYTSYGYIYGSTTALPEEVESDFRTFLSGEHVEGAAFRSLQFPNFVCNEVFDGQVFKVGNAASFIEPLEATAIALIKTELNLLSSWLGVQNAMPNSQMAGHLIRTVNDSLRRTVLEVSLFISWHYAFGSSHDTPFWKVARTKFEEGLKTFVPEEIRLSFEEQLRQGAKIPVHRVVRAETSVELNKLVTSFPEFPEPFGGITPLGFAQVGLGVGSWRND